MEKVFLLPCQTHKNKIKMQYFSFFPKISSKCNHTISHYYDVASNLYDGIKL